ncbi:MAG: NCS2 family permease [Gammaproteobacteria bacterium]|nr:NCS2 family permease [Gammaproteobacteria bacterium]NIM72937.1 NCS2 family permease [Gammaproteobacteria bacterium]NIN38548.1 NCS2 family permease [Gammaproteobacteria bacterium]NIO24689.1 NCS2 family permease [Gammaproteobacteria bacterium]NIO65292.1 NCS2 family permease [Gammaproteobacteria bacterium]
MLERLFDLKGHGTSVRTELLAGTTTFLTMAYIAFVNPAILAAAGMDFGAVFVATCLAAAIGTLIMGLYANYPIALAPGMGLNAFFAYGVVLGMGHSWQTALGAVFISGILFVILSLLPIREWIINSIPQSLKMAISAGIGLFLALIALKNAGIVTDHPATLVTMGDLGAPGALLALAGFFVIAVLHHRRIPGAVIIGILAVTAVGILIGVSEFKGISAMPPNPAPTLLAMDIAGALDVALASVIFTFLFVDLFDTAGTLVGVAHRAQLLDALGRLPRLKRALIADSTATVAGAALGTSPVTSYIESAAGTNVGGRTGLTAVVVAGAFLLCLFFAPLAETVPAYATAPALLFVACLMARGLSELPWDDVTEYAPGVLAAFAMPLTFSIANGIGLGFIAYAVIKILSGKSRECSPAVMIIGLLFVMKFAVV